MIKQKLIDSINPSAPMKAIKRNCIESRTWKAVLSCECIYDPTEPGTHLEQIENCEIKDCSFYNFRPITSKTKKEIKQERYDSLSQDEKDIIDFKNELFVQRINKKKIS